MVELRHQLTLNHLQKGDIQASPLPTAHDRYRISALFCRSAQ
jgi:hypothetical protein